LSAWLRNGTRFFKPVLRGSRAWRKLGKSEEWAPVHKLKNRPEKSNKTKNLQGDFSGPTDLPNRSDWEPSDNVDVNHPNLAIPNFLDRRPGTETEHADASDESIEQCRRAA
jgi:hypothetical protein